MSAKKVQVKPSLFRQPWQRWRYVVQAWSQQHATLPRPLALGRKSWSLYTANFAFFVKLIAVVALPAAIATTYFTDPSGNTAAAAYVAFAQLAMNAALLYAIVRLTAGRSIGVRAAYYEGSVLLVRLILFSVIMAAISLLLLFGVLIFAYGIVAPGAILSGGEKFLLTLLAMLVLVPGLVLAIRTGWGGFVIGATDQGPWQAARASWRATRGKVVIISLRALAAVLVLLLLVGAPAAFLLGLASWAQLGFLTVIVQTITNIVFAPLLITYLYYLYQGFKE